MIKEHTPLNELFENHKGIYTHKFPIHMEAYEGFFKPYKDRPEVRILEIGIAQGGSLQLWREYFGNKADVMAVDIQDMTALSKTVGAEILIGDQGDPEFWEKHEGRLNGLDIVIDDGSHKCSDQIAAFKILYPLLKDDGIYIVEDVHTSYRENYGGGLKDPRSFIEFTKGLIDELHANEFIRNSNDSYKHLFSLHVYPSLVIVKKRNENTWGGSTIRPISHVE